MSGTPKSFVVSQKSTYQKNTIKPVLVVVFGVLALHTSVAIGLINMPMPVIKKPIPPITIELLDLQESPVPPPPVVESVPVAKSMPVDTPTPPQHQAKSVAKPAKSGASSSTPKEPPQPKETAPKPTKQGLGNIPKPDNNSKGDKSDGNPKKDGNDSSLKGDKPDNNSKGDKPDGNPKKDGNDDGSKGDKPDNNSKGDKSDGNPKKDGNDSSLKGDKPDNSSKGDKSDGNPKKDGNDDGSKGDNSPITLTSSKVNASWKSRPNLHFDALESAEFGEVSTKNVTMTFNFDTKGKISNVQVTSTGNRNLDKEIKKRCARASLHPQIVNGVARSGSASVSLRIDF